MKIRKKIIFTMGILSLMHGLFVNAADIEDVSVDDTIIEAVEQDIVEAADIQMDTYVFMQPDGKYYVCDEEGNRVTTSGTPVIGGNKYYVAGDGYLKSGWLYLLDWKMYFDPETFTAKVGMADIDGKRYLFNSDGVMQNFAGTTIIDGKKYWFSTDNASLKTGWLNLGDWKLYFDPETYAALTGMVEIDGHMYLFNEDGVMQNIPGTPVIDGKKYWFSTEGYLKTGWLYLGNWKMYFDPKTYEAKVGMADIGGKKYLFNSDGVMQNYAGTTIIDGKKYWFSDDDASLKTGWLHLGPWTLYFDPVTYEAVTGFVRIDGATYYFNEDGVMYKGYNKIRIGDSLYSFDDSGRIISEERITMTWPVPGYNVITSKYGMQEPNHPNVVYYHQGINISAPEGTPVVAARDGVVTAAWYTSLMGMTIVIEHDNQVKTWYTYLSNYAVSEGQEVSEGDVIGYVGSTGMAEDNELHFVTMISGERACDPLYYDYGVEYEFDIDNPLRDLLLKYPATNK